MTRTERKRWPAFTCAIGVAICSRISGGSDASYLPPDSGKPMDAVVAERFVALGEFVNRPAAERRATRPDSDRFLDLWLQDNVDAKLCAVLAAAFADDRRGLEVLRAAARSDVAQLAGAAKFGLRMRDSRGGSLEAESRALADGFRISDDAYERLFIANRLVVDHFASSKSALAEAVGSDPASDVRLYVLACLTAKPDEALDRAALNAEWDERRRLPENLAFALRSLTPGMKPDAFARTAGDYLRELRRRHTPGR